MRRCQQCGRDSPVNTLWLVMGMVDRGGADVFNMVCLCGMDCAEAFIGDARRWLDNIGAKGF